MLSIVSVLLCVEKFRCYFFKFKWVLGVKRLFRLFVGRSNSADCVGLFKFVVEIVVGSLRIVVKVSGCFHQCQDVLCCVWSFKNVLVLKIVSNRLRLLFVIVVVFKFLCRI